MMSTILNMQFLVRSAAAGHVLDTVEHEVQRRRRESAELLGDGVPVEGHKLRYVRHGILLEPGRAVRAS